MFIQSFLAGICISLGGTAFLLIESKVVGAVFFTIGLFTICTRGYALYTGKVCYTPDKVHPVDVFCIWLGNFIGCYAAAFIVRMSTLNIDVTALVSRKLSCSLTELFFSAILCNICIFIAVDGFKTNDSPLMKCLSLFFGVTVFVICGMEHSVADMFYLAVSNTFSIQPKESALVLLTVTVGNAAGGISFRQLDNIRSIAQR